MTGRIEELARFTVARGCAFAALAIVCAMVGVSYDASLACRLGGLGALLVAFTLILMALQAPTRPVQHTEVWLLLPREERPPAATAQALVGQARRRACLAFALHAARGAAILLVVSVALKLFGP